MTKTLHIASLSGYKQLKYKSVQSAHIYTTGAGNHSGSL